MLKYVTSTLTAVALAGTVSVFAQQPASQPATNPQAQPPQATNPQGEKPQPVAEAPATETLTGCVMAAKTTTGETAYVLNNVEGKSATMYVLFEAPQSGLSATDWSANVNKKVEVTGPVQKPSAPAGEAGATGTSNAVRPPMMRAESMKLVADTCK